jgi:RNA polymerase sigma-70 factor (ECF subfamily)
MDAEIFKQQFLPFHPKLFRIAFALVGNKNDAEDIVQETYGKLWHKRKDWHTIHNTEAFSVTVVKNLCMDFLRSQQLRRSEHLSTQTVSAKSASPGEKIEASETMAQVKQLIAQLPQNQQQVLRLKGLNEYSIEEIAALTGFSHVNVRTLLSRARRTIREQLKDNEL